MPAFAQEFQATPNLFTDQWRKSFGRFVENDEPRIGHQRAADRQHLLLATGKEIGHRACTFGEPRKECKYFCERPRIGRAGAIGRGGEQIFARGQIWKDLAPFRHQSEAKLGNAVGGKPVDLHAVETDVAGAAGVSPMIERTVVVLPMPSGP